MEKSGPKRVGNTERRKYISGKGIRACCLKILHAYSPCLLSLSSGSPGGNFDLCLTHVSKKRHEIPFHTSTVDHHDRLSNIYFGVNISDQNLFLEQILIFGG